MKSKLKHLISAVFILFGLNDIYSQWLKLPSSITSEKIPANNNIILYKVNVNVSPSSGGYENTYISKNDLISGSCIGGCSFSPSYGCCNTYSLQSFNDSTFTHITRNQNYYYQRFKIDNSPFRQTVNCPENNSPISAICVTNKSAYAISHLYYNNDTLLFVRTTQTNPLIQSVKKITQYQSFAANKLSFLNDSLGFLTVVDKSNLALCKLLKTNDFGNNWSEIYIDSVNKIIDFHFPSESVGYILKSDSTMFKTIDAGVSWIQLTNPGILSFKCIKFANDTLGYVAGDGNKLSKTIDGGLTWTNEISGTINSINSLYAFGDIAYFVDSSNEVYKNKDVNIIGINELQNKEFELTIFPNPANSSITITTDLFQNQDFYIEIYNLLGESIYKSNMFFNDDIFNKEISLQNISNGVYTISIKNKTKSLNKKLIIN